tara:strand:- start:5 stop:133 length:129 start_codon:yes stop_codon:yes gene_type:complete
MTEAQLERKREGEREYYSKTGKSIGYRFYKSDNMAICVTSII